MDLVRVEDLLRSCIVSFDDYGYDDGPGLTVTWRIGRPPFEHDLGVDPTALASCLDERSDTVVLFGDTEWYGAEPPSVFKVHWREDRARLVPAGAPVLDMLEMTMEPVREWLQGLALLLDYVRPMGQTIYFAGTGIPIACDRQRLIR